MSAFEVCKAHIDAILTFAAFGLPRHLALKADKLDEVGQVLVDANVESVNYRYNEKDAADPYHFCRVRTLSPVEMLKALDCLEYQCCEPNDWKDSIAKKYIDQLRGWTIQALPGYDAAPWAIDADDAKRGRANPNVWDGFSERPGFC